MARNLSKKRHSPSEYNTIRMYFLLVVCVLPVLSTIVLLHLQDGTMNSAWMANAFSPLRLMTHAHVPTSHPQQRQQQDLFLVRTSAALFAAPTDGDMGDWFQQKPGENDIAFIKRITSGTPPTSANTNKKTEPSSTSNSSSSTSGKSGYQRIEDWEAQKQAALKNGTMSWVEKVQFEGQRHGNQVRQHDILVRQINSGL